MKNWCKKNILLLILFTVGIAAACGILLERNAIEKENKTYDIVINYSDYREMSNQSEEDLSYWLKLLSERGVTKVGLFETSVKSLSEDPETGVQYEYVWEIKKNLGWKETLPDEIVAAVERSQNSSDVLVICNDSENFDWIVDAYESRAEGIHYEAVRDGNTGYLWIYRTDSGLTGDKWMEFSLGLWPDQVEMIENSGCTVIPRTKTMDGANGEQFASAVFDDFEAYESPYFMNSGDSLPGYDDENWSEALAGYLDRTDAAVVVTESMTEQGNINWNGFSAFVESTGYKAVRAFNMWDFVQQRYQVYGYEGPEEIVNSLYRTIYERNCHLIYLSPILKEGAKDKEIEKIYITDPDAYEQMITGLFERMDSYGYSFETLTPAENYNPGTFLRFLIGVGEIAAAVMLLLLFVKLSGKAKHILLGVGILLVAAALFAAPNTSKILLCLGGGIVMPCLAAVGLNRYLQKTEKYGDKKMRSLLPELIAVTACLFLVSFCGSLFTAASLSESGFMLEMTLYRGVKFMQLVPLMVFFISYIQIFVFERYIFKPVGDGVVLSRREMRLKRRSEWNAFLDRPVKLRGIYYGIIVVIVLLFLMLIGAYYIIRTGNLNNEMVPSLEIQIRNFFEETLAARPRTKEWLIGYPCMMMMIWAFRRRIPGLPLLFGIGSVIGFTSIVNTFLHIRTMLEVSFARVLIGFSFGLAAGLVFVICLEIIYRLVLKYKNAYR
ncbi:MAG: DUF5693 family protein [Clostridia bacterium]